MPENTDELTDMTDDAEADIDSSAQCDDCADSKPVAAEEVEGRGEASDDAGECTGEDINDYSDEVYDEETAEDDDTEVSEELARELESEEDFEDSGASQAPENAAADEESDDSDIEDEDEFQLPLDQVIEALLFTSEKPLKIEKLAKAAGRGIRREKVREVIDQLNEHYTQTSRSFEIVEIAETFQIMSRPEFSRCIQRLHGKKAQKEEDKSRKLSPAALDTLAIIAYKQPVTRADVEAVRGVGCGQIMRQLMERGSIRPVGKKMDVIGYPLLYGTTREFLEEFGLPSLEQLPMINEMRRVTGTEEPIPDPNAIEEQATLLDAQMAEEDAQNPGALDDAPAAEAGETEQPEAEDDTHDEGSADDEIDESESDEISDEDDDTGEDSDEYEIDEDSDVDDDIDEFDEDDEVSEELAEDLEDEHLLEKTDE